MYVCVPPFAHGPAEEAVIEAGVPMFVEKPVAVDLGTAERIADLVARRGLRTAVGHHWRYLSVLDQARDLLADRPVRMVSGAWLDKVPPVAWWSRRDRSGGPVVEQAAHVLDLIRVLAGEVTEVTAYGNGTPPPVDGADIDSVTTAALRFADGAVGTLSAACVLGWKHRAGLEILADGLALVAHRGRPDDPRRRRGTTRPRRPGGRPGRRGPRLRRRRRAASATTSACRTPRRCATQRLALAVADSARTGTTGAARHPDRPAALTHGGDRRCVTRSWWSPAPAGSSWSSRTPPPLRPTARSGSRRCYSGVSAGTELSYVKGTNPYLNVTWNADLGLFQPGAAEHPATR